MPRFYISFPVIGNLRNGESSAAKGRRAVKKGKFVRFSYYLYLSSVRSIKFVDCFFNTVKSKRLPL